MERITNATINVISACLLFFILFSACSRSTQVNKYEKEKSYARASWEIEQGHVKPVASYVAPVTMPEVSTLQFKEENQLKEENNMVASKKYSINLTKKQKNARKDSVIQLANSSYHQRLGEATTTQTSATPAILKWARMLAFLPIAVAVALMQRKMSKRNQKEDTVIIGGLISLLVVILLVVLILALI